MRNLGPLSISTVNFSRVPSAFLKLINFAYFYDFVKPVLSEENVHKSNWLLVVILHRFFQRKRAHENAVGIKSQIAAFRRHKLDLVDERFAFYHLVADDARNVQVCFRVRKQVNMRSKLRIEVETDSLASIASNHKMRIAVDNRLLVRLVFWRTVVFIDWPANILKIKI